jgi:hypothetical protein
LQASTIYKYQRDHQLNHQFPLKNLSDQVDLIQSSNIEKEYLVLAGYFISSKIRVCMRGVCRGLALHTSRPRVDTFFIGSWVSPRKD